MRHLKIEFIGYRHISNPYYNVVAQGSTVFGETQYQHTEPIVRVEIDKRSWDEMFDLYEAHLRGRCHPAVKDAWEQYLATLALCGEQNFNGDKHLKL